MYFLSSQFHYTKWGARWALCLIKGGTGNIWLNSNFIVVCSWYFWLKLQYSLKMIWNLTKLWVSKCTVDIRTVQCKTKQKHKDRGVREDQLSAFSEQTARRILDFRFSTYRQIIIFQTNNGQTNTRLPIPYTGRLPSSKFRSVIRTECRLNKWILTYGHITTLRKEYWHTDTLLPDKKVLLLW